MTSLRKPHLRQLEAMIYHMKDQINHKSLILNKKSSHSNLKSSMEKYNLIESPFKNKKLDLINQDLVDKKRRICFNNYEMVKTIESQESRNF